MRSVVTQINTTWQNRAELAIGQSALTNSKRPSTFVEGVYPTHASHGRGCFIYADGEPYYDFINGLGTNLVGYGHPALGTAIFDRYMKGATLSLSSQTEVTVAEKLKALFPWTELWKFTKSGTEACSAAIKIARAHTGRDLVLSDGYHGWTDDFVSLTEPALGVPKRDWIERLDFGRIPLAAAVIIEPVITDWSKGRKEYLHTLKKECQKHGTVLIFDEIITGFRFPSFSVARYFGVEPDLILLGKAMGGGLPLSAIGGSKKILDSEYFISGTFFGETVSLEACLALIELLRRDGTKYLLKDLWDSGAKFLSQFNAFSKNLRIAGYPTRGAFEGDTLTKALFWQEACKAKILFGPSWFYSFPLMSEIDTILPICRDILRRVDMGLVKLEGKMPATPFAQKVRG